MEARTNTSPTIHENVSSSTITLGSNRSPPTATNTLRLTANQAHTIIRRRVSWTTETVDNEGMGKKKSKCCCIYQKPRAWDQSSSEDENEDEDCQNCRGHRKKDFNSANQPKNDDDVQKKHGNEHEHEHHHHHHHHEHSDWNNDNSQEHQ